MYALIGLFAAANLKRKKPISIGNKPEETSPMFGARFILAAAALCVGVSTVAAKVVAPASVQIKNGAVTASLTGAPGDPAAGRKYFANKKLGNCLACHANKDMSKQLFHGNIGPPLDGVASRWKPEQLRAILVNAKAVFGPDTVMPGFYSLDVGKNVRKDLIGRTILSAEQVEAIVAYLSTLK
jgi:sulfur-oxidizing protein SoxX